MKTDYKKEYKQYYKMNKTEPCIIDVQAMNYLMINGKGDPNTSKAYMDAIEALYAVSYTLKFMSKKNEHDYVVMPLESQWWMDGEWDMERREEWQWTAMIMQPPCINEAMFNEAVETVRKKKNPVALDQLRFDTIEAHKAVHVLHKGPYSEEGPTIEKLHSFMDSEGYTFGGKHYEIYLSDPRKAAPDKMKTIIRQPIIQKG